MGTTNRITVWIAGDVLTAAALNGEFNNILSTLNGNINADNIDLTDDYTFSGTMLFSGVTNLAGTGANFMSNVGLFSATTTNTRDSVKISSRTGTALSSTNPAYIVMPSTATAGALIIGTFISDVTILLTGATWGAGGLGDLTGALLRVLCINDNATMRFGVALLGGRTTVLTTDTNATQASVNLPEEILCNAAIGSASNRCREIGYVRADFDDTGGAAEDLWTIQSGLNDIVVGQSCDGLWQPFRTTVVGFSANPATFELEFTQIGRTIFINYRSVSGTSGGGSGTTYTATMPCKRHNDASIAPAMTGAYAIDNSVQLTTAPIVTIAGDSLTATFYKDASQPAWTAANNKRWVGNFYYQVGPSASFID